VDAQAPSADARLDAAAPIADAWYTSGSGSDSPPDTSTDSSSDDMAPMDYENAPSYSEWQPMPPQLFTGFPVATLSTSHYLLQQAVYQPMPVLQPDAQSFASHHLLQQAVYQPMPLQHSMNVGINYPVTFTAVPPQQQSWGMGGTAHPQQQKPSAVSYAAVAAKQKMFPLRPHNEGRCR
jgi:hypothetical protein